MPLGAAPSCDALLLWLRPAGERFRSVLRPPGWSPIELGHVLGLEDLDAHADELMAAWLVPGRRRLPIGEDLVDAVFAGGW